eukprot:3922348-Pleurochrysis_carterae.AAC.2
MASNKYAAWRRRRRIKKKAAQVAVVTARMPCMIMIPSDGCALEMALRTVGLMHMSMSSQSSVHASACALEGGGMTPKRSACQSSDAGVGLAGRIGRVIVVVAVVVLGGDVERKVEAEGVAVVIGAEHGGLVELFGLELETFEALVFELGLVTRRPLALLIAMSAKRSRTRAAVVAAEL